MSSDDLAPEEELEVLQRLTALLIPDETTTASREASHVVWHIIRLARHIEQRMEYSVHRPLGWSWAGFRIMVNLYALESADPSKLALILGVSRPTIANVLSTLESGGFISRTPDPENRRRTIVTLTEAGAEAVREAIPVQRQVEGEIVSSLSATERHQLVTALARLHANL
ncbi:MAG: MarR family winged helix-turn-helix transcriptional regulator [Acidimicrobiales bacterium]